MASIWVEGAEDLLKIAVEFERRSGQVGQLGAKVVKKTAFAIEKTGKELVRVDTGHLKGSITTDFAGDGRFGQMSAEIGPEASYGGYIEWGTSRHGPYPYMAPAAELHFPMFEAAMAQIADPFERPKE